MSGAPSSSSTNTDGPYTQVNEFSFISALVIVENEKSFSLAFNLYRSFGRSGISFSCLPHVASSSSSSSCFLSLLRLLLLYSIFSSS
jgi:hypothetical protein